MITNEAAKYLCRRDAVRRSGAAVRDHRRRVDPGFAARILDLPRIVAFRNVLIHGYATIDARLA